MNIEIIKEELIKRYRFIYENALFILGPLVKEVNSPFLGLEKVINLLDLPEDFAYLLEEFLLTDKKMEETSFYQKMLELKNNSSYLLAVKEGLALLNKKNASTYPSLKEELTVFEVLQLVREYIDSQESDINNKEKKLRVLDEYFRISRYTNDNNTWISGAELEVSDISKGIKIKSGIRKRNIKVYKRKKYDNGIRDNDFINIISNHDNYGANQSFLSEEEKERIYMLYHDEIPWHQMLTCEENGDFIGPINTFPCQSSFYLKEEDIFIKDNNYYMLCPNCGFMVRVNKSLLTKSSIQRIKERCSSDPQLFHKMYLYSELYNLDKKDGFKILKK